MMTSPVERTGSVTVTGGQLGQGLVTMISPVDVGGGVITAQLEQGLVRVTVGSVSVSVTGT